MWFEFSRVFLTRWLLTVIAMLRSPDPVWNVPLKFTYLAEISEWDYLAAPHPYWDVYPAASAIFRPPGLVEKR
jgi:hypothetical protein